MGYMVLVASTSCACHQSGYTKVVIKVVAPGVGCRAVICRPCSLTTALFHTFTLSHFYSFTPSCFHSFFAYIFFHSFIPSHFHSSTLSHFHSFTLSLFHTFTLADSLGWDAELSVVALAQCKKIDTLNLGLILNLPGVGP